MKEIIYIAIIWLGAIVLIYKDKIKEWFQTSPKNYAEKESITGVKHWVPIKPKAPKKYPTPNDDIIDEWVDSLECSEVMVNGKKIYVMDQDDILQLKKVIVFKYGFLIE